MNMHAAVMAELTDSPTAQKQLQEKGWNFRSPIHIEKNGERFGSSFLIHHDELYIGVNTSDGSSVTTKFKINEIILLAEHLKQQQQGVFNVDVYKYND